MDLPSHIVCAEPALAVGSGFTVMVTESVSEHPVVFVATSLYVVVAVGVTVGLEELEVKPVGLDVHA